MVIVGIDAHKRTHTAVAVDEVGRELATKTVRAQSEGHLELARWASALGEVDRWAVEDCRQVTGNLERDLIAVGETIARVPPKLMAQARSSARTYGKSDPIDALSVARAALRHPDLPAARLDGPARTIRLLVDHREHLVNERTRSTNRLRWHLHELDPTFEAAKRLTLISNLNKVAGFLANHDGPVAMIATEIVERCIELTSKISDLEKEMQRLVKQMHPSLLAICGCATINAAKIVGETADVTRFKNEDAYARHNGTAPKPVWSANPNRFRLSRSGNRQLNAVIHRIAVTQMRRSPAARQLVARRRATGDSTKEAMRVLKRHLSNVVYRALIADVSGPAAELGVAA